MILKAKEMFLDLSSRDKCIYLHKNPFCIFWKNNRRDSIINGEDEIQRNFKYVEIQTNE